MALGWLGPYLLSYWMVYNFIVYKFFFFYTLYTNTHTHTPMWLWWTPLTWNIWRSSFPSSFFSPFLFKIFWMNTFSLVCKFMFEGKISCFPWLFSLIQMLLLDLHQSIFMFFFCFLCRLLLFTRNIITGAA